MQRLYVDVDRPQPRLLGQIAARINNGEVVVCPTDTAYAFICQIGNKAAVEQICRIRQLDDTHQFTMMCKDLSQISSYAKLNNTMFKLLKAHTPSRCTFILPASNEVPKRLQHPKKKTIGIRIPTDGIMQQLLDICEQPLITSTLKLAGQDVPMDDPEEIEDSIGKQITALLDAGILERSETTVLDCTDDYPVLVREGVEDVSGWF